MGICLFILLLPQSKSYKPIKRISLYFFLIRFDDETAWQKSEKLFFLLVDLDECERGDHDCHKYGVCHNEIGSYSCHCQFGYVGNGTWCEGTVLS